MSISVGLLAAAASGDMAESRMGVENAHRGHSP